MLYTVSAQPTPAELGLPLHKNRRPKHVYRPRHPVTNEPLWFSAPTAAKLAELRAWVEGLRLELKSGRRTADDVMHLLHRARKRSRVLVGRIFEGWLKTLSNPNTYARAERARRRELLPLMARDPDALSPLLMAQWRADGIRRGFEANSLVVAFRYLAAAFQYAVQERIVLSDPWGTWRPRGSKQLREREATRTIAELEALLAAGHAIDTERRDRGQWADLYARLTVAALLGLRTREGAALAWSDLDTSGELWTVRVRFQTYPRWQHDHPEWTRPSLASKGRRRKAPILVHPAARIALEAQRNLSIAWGLYGDDGPIFPRVDQRAPPLEAEWRQELFGANEMRHAAKRAGLPNVERWSSHSARDSFVTLEAQGHCFDLKTVAQRSQHGSVSGLYRYLRARARTLPLPGIGELALPPAHGQNENASGGEAPSS